jgi:RimJ/RimL family protein N-acetyltransferase
MKVAPVLETERLRLRGHRVEDFPVVAELWSDVRTVEFIGRKPSNGEEAWARLLRYAGLWAMLGYGYWVLEDKATGVFLGECGFAEYQREMVPSIAGRPEAGWVLAQGAHGRGYATEAMTAVLAWGRERFGDERAVCLIDPENLASLRVAEKLGFVEERRGMFRGHETVVLGRGGVAV